MNIRFETEPLDLRIADRRSRELMAVERLLAKIGHPNVSVSHNPDGSPFIRGVDLKISISHSRRFAAIAFGESAGFGIDIEEPRPAQLKKVAPRFLTPNELNYYSSLPDGLLKAWTLKEAAFKTLRNGPADLRNYSLPLDTECHEIIVGHHHLVIHESRMILPNLFLSIVTV